MKLFLGIDPGISGATSIIDADRNVMSSLSHKKATPLDLSELLLEFYEDIVLGMIERVHSMPKQGVASSFTFGEQYGLMQGLLYANEITFEYVTPAKWMKHLNCRTGGNKNITKALAQRTFRGVKIIHANADSLLLAEYARLIAVEKGLV